MLECKDLTVSFGKLDAIRSIDVSIAEGRITSVIGANGAGKTTLVRAISGLEKARHGRITFDGNDVTNRDPSRIVRLGLSHVPAGFQLFRNLTVLENLRLGAYIHAGKDPAQTIQQLEFVFDLFPILSERKNQVSGTLSGGQQQMVSIGRALMARPKMLLLDEPSLGLAPMIVESILEALARLNDQQGLSILLIEQNASLALNFASYAYLLENGSVADHGTTESLRKKPSVVDAYLGG